MKIIDWLKELWFEFTHDPNSAEGLRMRAKRLIKKGYALDNPYISALLKQALLKEDREKEIPNPDEWEAKSSEEKEEWVFVQLDIKEEKYQI